MDVIYMKGRGLKILFISLLALFVAACAAPKIEQNVVMPANENGMQSVKKVAVLGFSGDPKQEFSIKLEAFLVNIKVNNKPYFTVVDRKALDVIIREQRMVSESGLFNEKDIVKVGELSGVDTVMNGFVKWPKMEYKSFYEDRGYCAKADSKGKCIKWGSKKVKCTQQLSRFSVTVKAVSVQKGDVVFSKAYNGSGNNKYCSDSIGASKMMPSELAKIAMSSAMKQMRRDMAPYTIVMTIKLMDGDDSSLEDNDNAIKLFESGLDFAGAKRMDRACEKFREATAVYNKSPALYHNLGVCSEINGELEKALRMHERADGLLDKPDELINVALNRVKTKMKNKSEVAGQLR